MFAPMSKFYSLRRLSPGLAFLLSVLAVNLAFALPTESGAHSLRLLHNENIMPIDRRVPNFYARILPLGASIIQGRGSSSGNG
jgi:hypothetical protein